LRAGRIGTTESAKGIRERSTNLLPLPTMLYVLQVLRLDLIEVPWMTVGSEMRIFEPIF
jgi:hypothetical protein